MTTKNKLIQRSKQMLNEGETLENVLSFLRHNQCSKTQTIVLLKEIQNISLDKSKTRVHFSQTWQDTRESDEELNQRFHEILTNDNVLS